MSAFESDFAEDIKDPQFAYEFGRFERELEIIKLLEERKCGCYCEVHMVLDPAIAAIKGEK